MCRGWLAGDRAACWGSRPAWGCAARRNTPAHPAPSAWPRFSGGAYVYVLVHVYMHTQTHTLALYSDLSGQSHSRVSYGPKMPAVPSCLNTKDIFKWRENNVFTVNVSCIFCSLPHTHDVALRVLLQVGLHHPCCVLSVGHNPATGGRCGQDRPAQLLSPITQGISGRVARRSGVNWTYSPALGLSHPKWSH